MANRTFGWVQNPNVLATLRNVVEVLNCGSRSNVALIDDKLPMLLKYNFITKENHDIFIEQLSATDIEIPYELLKGEGKGKAASRKDALCSGIIQASITAHSTNKTITDDNGNSVVIKKPYVDDWTSDGYLRWAISTGLLHYDNETDKCKISDLGKQLIATERDSEEEKEIFARALLAYPPVYRVLDILSDREPYTKFEIGSKLGFKGEMGFTSIPQEVFVYDYCTESSATKKKDIKSNTEGDSDKYARTIANWLVQMGWLEKTTKEVTETYFGLTNTTTIQAWRITRDGEKAIIKSKGNSSNPQIPKIVLFEMLATKVPSADYIRLRRANILKELRTEKTLNSIQTQLYGCGMNESIQTIEDDILNFSNIGIVVNKKNNKYKLADKIVGLNIPTNTSTITKADIITLKDNIRTKLHNINHDYLVLVDLAYSDADSKQKKNIDAKEFEIQTANLLTKELKFKGERLGDSNKPDAIIYYDEYGTIIDTKSYKDGFSVDKHCADEMSRYIIQNNKRIPGSPKNEWWKRFDCNVTEFTFLFVTSFLKGNFKNNLTEISNNTSLNGAAIGVDNLLYLAESLKDGTRSYGDFFDLFNNDEIRITA